MISSLKELNNVINDVVNDIVKVCTEHTSTGNWYVSYNDVSDLISEEDFLKYFDFIRDELLSREEVLELNVTENREFDVTFGLDYCPNYEWCDGDEVIFDMTENEWEQNYVTKPVEQPYSMARKSDLLDFALTNIQKRLEHDSEDRILEVAEFFGISVEDLARLELPAAKHTLEEIRNRNNISFTEIGTLGGKDKEQTDIPFYKTDNELFVGNWRVEIVPPKSRYGRSNQLTNDSDKYIVQFFDLRHIDPVYSPNGQFTGGQYYADTLLDDEAWRKGDYSKGLCLDADIPEWTVSGKEMEIVMDFVSENVMGKEKSSLEDIISSATKRTGENQTDKNSRDNEIENGITVVMLEPGKMARKATIDSSLEGLQKAVGGYIEAFYPFEEMTCIVCNEEGKLNGMPLNRAIYSEPEEVEMTYAELTNLFRSSEDEGKHITGYVVFTQDSFKEPYSEASRTYAISSDNKAFQSGMGGYSIYGECMDGTDPCVRLERYMAAEHGGKDGWKIERCYTKAAERAIVDIIAGPCFICDCKGEDFGSLNDEQINRYIEQFKYPEHFYRVAGEIKAVPYPPEKGQER